MNILNNSKFLIQRILRYFGWEIVRHNKSEIIFLSSRLNELNVDTIFDVGANQGQYANSLFSSNFKGKIFSFEPYSKAHKSLLKLAKKNSGWYVPPRCAVGRINKMVTLNISENSVSSSLLPMLDEHLNSAKKSRYIGTEFVPLITLDSFAKSIKFKKAFLKIDTQGYELEVVLGAKSLMKKLVGIQLEVSIGNLYDGQPNYLYILKHIEKKGFNLWSITPGFRDKKTNKLLQFDAIFLKK
jgi:FkbM family methyltransferase